MLDEVVQHLPDVKDTSFPTMQSEEGDPKTKRLQGHYRGTLMIESQVLNCR